VRGINPRAGIGLLSSRSGDHRGQGKNSQGGRGFGGKKKYPGTYKEGSEVRSTLGPSEIRPGTLSGPFAGLSIGGGGGGVHGGIFLENKVGGGQMAVRVQKAGAR